MSATTNTVLLAEDVSFAHTKGEYQVRGASFTLRAGRTFGVLGGNECGKTTLARVLLGELAAITGRVTILGTAIGGGAARPSWLLYSRLAFAFFVACALVLLALGRPGTLLAGLDAGGWAPPLLLMILEAAYQLQARRGNGVAIAKAIDKGMAPDELLARGIAYISSEHDGGQKLDGRLTIEEAIGRPMKASKEARRKEVLAALTASGFQMYEDSGKPVGNPEKYLADGVKVGELSGGQRHLIYMLSVLASQPRVLICDEALCGLDVDRQSSMLELLQKLQLQYGMAILFMTVDLTSFSIMAHEGAFMHKGRQPAVGGRRRRGWATDSCREAHEWASCRGSCRLTPVRPLLRGRFIEVGDAHALIASPTKGETRVYVKESQEIENMGKGKNLKNAYSEGVSVFDI